MTSEIKKTIFRVVGGHAHRSKFEKYEIIPYEVVRETARYYFVQGKDKIELQQKRETNNSSLHDNIDDAIKKLISKIDAELKSIKETFDEVSKVEQKRNVLFRGKFDRGVFHIKENYIIEKTKTAWKIDTEAVTNVTRKIRGQWAEVEVQKGRSYIYPHTSAPHNPERPYEKWIGTDVELIKSLMQLYFEDRVKYLNWAKQHFREWVRLWIQQNKH